MDETASPKARFFAPSASVLFDEYCVALALSGDKLGAERLFIRWNPRLLRAARRYTGDDGVAEQLAQDCWLAIWRGLGRLDNPAKFRAWAFGILRRKGADAIRDAVRERGATADDPDAEQAVPPRQEDAWLIARAFDALPADQRLAAHLYFSEGLTLSEIAAVQAIPLGTAKTRLFHARRKLKAALGETEGDDR